MSDHGHGHGRKFYRLTLFQRIQHNLIMLTFSFVILTGFPLKFHGADWTYPMIKMFGGVYMAGRIHRANGVVMVLLFVVTLTYIIATTVQKCMVVFKESPSTGVKDAALKIIKVVYGLPMVPDANDGRCIVDFFRYVFFLNDKPPQYGKVMWKEKFDYLAVFWGIPVFGLTGPMMWFPTVFAKFLPPMVINIALIVHSDEALLAAGVIFTWHLYTVALAPESFPIQGTLLDGCVSEHHMQAEYPSEYKRIMIEEGEDSPSIVRPDED